MSDGLKIIGIILLLALILASPIATIWALNALFHLTIPFTFKTWCATGILEAVFYSRKGGKS